MNLHALRLFHEVAAAGSVSVAADKLHISQPAVTMQLRKLEKELGFALTRQQGRGLCLTEAGLWLKAQANRLFTLEADIERQCEAYRFGMTGQLKLAATYLPANFMLPAWIAAYREASPSVEVSVSSGNARLVMEKLLRYEADIAWIGGHHSYPPSIVAVPCYEDELWFVAPPNHRLAGQTRTLAELAREPFIYREQGSFTRDALLAMYRTANLPPPQQAVQLDGPQETIRAAMQGLGLTIASRMEVSHYITSGSLARIDTDIPPVVYPVSRCVRTDDPLSPQASSFVESSILI